MEESSNPLQNRHLFMTMKRSSPMEVTAIARDPQCTIKQGTYLTDQQAGDLTTTFNKESVEQLTTKGTISPEVGTALLSIFEDQEKRLDLMKLVQESEDSPDKESYLKRLESDLQKDPRLQLNAVRHLLAVQTMSSSKIPDELYYGIDQENCFFIAKVLTDRLRYIPELLKKSEVFTLPHEGNSRYLIRSSKELTKDIGEIGLSHAFTLPPGQTIEDYFNQYIDDMQAAIKFLLAYWAVATAMGNYQYLTPITTIIAVTTSKDRKSSISIKEKKRFWALSKLLGSTQFVFKCKIGDEYINFNRPLLDLSITASFSKDQEISKGYPDKVMPCVLSPELKEAALRVTEISKGTLLLNKENIFFALYPQARASQISKNTFTEIDEKFAMEQAGLSRTYKSNPRMARKILKEKLKAIEEANAISGFEVSKKGTIKMNFRQTKADAKKQAKRLK